MSQGTFYFARSSLFTPIVPISVKEDKIQRYTGKKRLSAVSGKEIFELFRAVFHKGAWHFSNNAFFACWMISSFATEQDNTDRCVEQKIPVHIQCAVRVHVNLS